MQPYVQLLATICAITNAKLIKFVENYIQLQNKLHLVANGENEYPCRAGIKNTKITTKSTKNNYKIN